MMPQVPSATPDAVGVANFQVLDQDGNELTQMQQQRTGILSTKFLYDGADRHKREIQAFLEQDNPMDEKMRFSQLKRNSIMAQKSRTRVVSAVRSVSQQQQMHLSQPVSLQKLRLIGNQSSLLFNEKIALTQMSMNRPKTGFQQYKRSTPLQQAIRLQLSNTNSDYMSSRRFLLQPNSKAKNTVTKTPVVNSSLQLS